MKILLFLLACALCTALGVILGGLLACSKAHREAYWEGYGKGEADTVRQALILIAKRCLTEQQLAETWMSLNVQL